MGTNLGLLAYSEGIFLCAPVCNIPYVTAILNAFTIKGVVVRLTNEVGEGGGENVLLDLSHPLRCLLWLSPAPSGLSEFIVVGRSTKMDLILVLTRLKRSERE